jgi:NADH-quinone oxidoreductase subunit L
MFRLFFTVFHGECRASAEVRHHIHESPKVMTIPLAILAFLSLVGGYVGIPSLLGGNNAIEHFLAPIFGSVTPAPSTAGGFELIGTAWASTTATAGHETSLEMTLMVASVMIALFGIILAYILYVKRPELPGRFTAAFSRLYRAVNNKYFVDEFYELLFVRGTLKAGALLLKVVDNGMIEGAVNGLAVVVERAGGRLRRLETGYVQEYALAVIFGAVIVIGYLVVIPMF